MLLGKTIPMMGTKVRIFAPIAVVSFEDLVPSNHFYRHLDHVLDLSFVRDLVKKTYAHGGRPSYALLRQDHETLSHLAPGAKPPEPMLYDPQLHRYHRTGHYQPLSRTSPVHRIVHVQP